jgi:hypothetical protein
MVTLSIFRVEVTVGMSILCRYCGNRVASLASLPGHYRRKHPERVTARSGIAPIHRTGQWALSVPAVPQRAGIAPGATERVSDSAYIAMLERKRKAESQHAKNVESVAAKPNGRPVKSDWSFWVLVGIVVIVFLFASDSGSGARKDSRLVSTYQPEGTGQ